MNNNTVCDVNEPYTTSNSAGDYTLALAKEQHDAVHSIVATGGTDIGTGKVFVGTLTAVKEGQQSAQNITPLTTMVEARYKHCQVHQQECHETVSQIESKLAAYLGLTVNDINGDIVALANSGHDGALKTALALHNAALVQNGNNPYGVYQELAQYGFPAGHYWQEDIKTLMPKVSGLVTGIMATDANDLEAYAAGKHETAHQIAQYVDDLVHPGSRDTVDHTTDTVTDEREDVKDIINDTTDTVTDEHEIEPPMNPLRG
jgi:hypothetical protein